MEMLTLQLEETSSPPTLLVEGELDLATADQLRAALSKATAQHAGLRLDMAGVTFVDAVGLRVILEAAAALNGHGPLRIVGGPRVERLLELVGLGGLPSIVFSAE